MTLFTGCSINDTEEINGGIEQHDVGMMEMDSTTTCDIDTTKSCDIDKIKSCDIDSTHDIYDEPIDGLMEISE